MNKERRKEIESILSYIASLKDRIESVASEERDYYDNMPENMQNGDKGSQADEAAGHLEEAASDLDGITNELEEAIQ